MAANATALAPLREAVATLLSAAEATPLSSDRVHLLVPAERWDWGVAPIGGAPAARIAFCDTMPASCAAGSEYAASSDSFSEAYASFLELLVDFSPAPLLERARAAVAEPLGDPASTPSPPGWTKAEDGSGVLRWAPDWILAAAPSSWSAQLPSRTPASLELDAVTRARLYGLGAAPAQVASLPGKQLSVAGVGWSRVPVYPGSWYSSSAVELGRGGPFAADRAPQTVVGPAGLLRCRVSELIVAEQVSVTAALPRALDVANASGAQLGSIAVDAAGMRAESGELTVTTPPGEPYLVGAIYSQP